MTADIRTAAQREAEMRVPQPAARSFALAEDAAISRRWFSEGAVWAAARVTPTREQIAGVLDEDRYYDPDQISNLVRADAVLALMQELAEGEK